MQNGEVKSCLTRATLQNRYRVVMVKWSACLPLTPLIRVWNLQFWFCKIVWTVVVAQLVERSLPTPEIRSSNPVIVKILYVPTIKCIEKKKIKEKWPRMSQLFFLKMIKIFFIFGVKISLSLWRKKERRRRMAISETVISGSFLHEEGRGEPSSVTSKKLPNVREQGIGSVGYLWQQSKNCFFK